MATPRPGMPGCSNAARLMKLDTNIASGLKCRLIAPPSSPLASSLSDLGVVGCKSAAATHFSPSFWPIAELWACSVSGMFNKQEVQIHTWGPGKGNPTPRRQVQCCGGPRLDQRDAKRWEAREGLCGRSRRCVNLTNESEAP